MTLTKEQLYQKYLNLPDNVKEAMGSIELLDLLEDVTKKYNLHVDQRGKLANEVGLFLLGVTRQEEFLDKIQQSVSIPLETAGEIVKELNAKVFYPIRASLEKIANGSSVPYRPEQAPNVENFSPAGNVSDLNIKKDESPLPNPNNNAIILNTNQGADRKVFDEKMGKLFRLPKEVTEIGLEGEEKRTASIMSDPYRELPN